MLLRTRVTLATQYVRTCSGFYKLREWVENEPHQFFKEELAWGKKWVPTRTGDLVQSGYLFECNGALPELKASACRETITPSKTVLTKRKQKRN